MPKRTRISEMERPPSSPPPEELLALMEADARPITQADLRETVWNGGRNSIDLNGSLAGDLGDRSALDEILLAIIDAHAGAPIARRGGKPAKKSGRIYRLEQARRQLTGQPLSSGPPVGEYEEVLERVARRYYSASFGLDDADKTLRGLIVEEATTAEERANLDHKELDALIKSHTRAFKANRDRLLVKVSSSGIPEVEERRAKVATVIQFLVSLNVIPSR